uniref:Uncharacterized protein n=1 Tax=Ananas comosus var. bracteatus TaxID=296719 RepID=A0A6V7P8G2_ANACO|nr:unnamed protein product [Ananas comosus var. bracteatus]
MTHKGKGSGSGSGSGGSGPAPFLMKTHEMVEAAETDDVISWGRRAVVRRLEARRVRPRPAAPPLQAQQLLLLRPPAQHLRFPQGGAAQVGVRERELPAGRARPTLQHSPPQGGGTPAAPISAARNIRRQRAVAAASSSPTFPSFLRHQLRRCPQLLLHLLPFSAAANSKPSPTVS